MLQAFKYMIVFVHINTNGTLHCHVITAYQHMQRQNGNVKSLKNFQYEKTSNVPSFASSRGDQQIVLDKEQENTVYGRRGYRWSDTQRTAGFSVGADAPRPRRRWRGRKIRRRKPRGRRV
eukprot:91901_1